MLCPPFFQDVSPVFIRVCDAELPLLADTIPRFFGFLIHVCYTERICSFVLELTNAGFIQDVCFSSIWELPFHSFLA